MSGSNEVTRQYIPEDLNL